MMRSGIFITSQPDSHLYDKLRNKYRSEDGYNLKFCRGLKMRTAESLFDEMSSCLQFPYYFGENWNALEDCLNDMLWAGSSAHILCISNSEHILSGEKFDMLANFLKIIENVHCLNPYYSNDVNERSVPFGFILNYSSENKFDRGLFDSLGVQTSLI